MVSVAAASNIRVMVISGLHRVGLADEMTLCQTGQVHNDQLRVKHLSSRNAEILLAVERDTGESLQAQIERQVRDAVRNGALRPGAAVPSTRDLAADLGVSRPLVMEAYAQLAAEGYLALRQGAAPRVSEFAAKPAPVIPPNAIEAPEEFRYNFKTGTPDLQNFPRAQWIRATSKAIGAMGPEEFGYGHRTGAVALREALADYLGRVRGVSADPKQILCVGGFDQSRALFANVLWDRGIRRIAAEDPGYMDRKAILKLGFEVIPVPVDDDGIIVTALEKTGAEAVMLSPAHQFPTGGVMSGARRLELAAWLRRHNAIALEDDYDAEFRYDRAPVGALQGLEPEHVVYVGTVSKTLAPALRMGWIVAPVSLLAEFHEHQRIADNGRSRLEQNALAEFIRSGDFDRHLRKMRSIYRDRRAALLTAIEEELPGAVVGGIAAGLHATVGLPQRVDEPAMLQRALKRGAAFSFMRPHYHGVAPHASTVLLSYARLNEAQIRAGMKAIGAAWRESQV
jgi:GntR family transcriptional regulator/MocR family aminotransferase